MAPLSLAAPKGTTAARWRTAAARALLSHGSMLPTILRRPSQVAVAFFACAALAAAPAAAQGTHASAGNPEVTELTLKGVHAVHEDELRNNIATDESHCASLLLRPMCLFSKSPLFYKHVTLDRAELSRDMLRVLVFYFRRGYRETQVDTTIVPTGKHAVHVTIAVNEGPPTIVSAVRVVTSLLPSTAMLATRARHRGLTLRVTFTVLAAVSLTTVVSITASA